jgi:hypothetical protein
VYKLLSPHIEIEKVPFSVQTDPTSGKSKIDLIAHIGGNDVRLQCKKTGKNSLCIKREWIISLENDFDVLVFAVNRSPIVVSIPILTWLELMKEKSGGD